MIARGPIFSKADEAIFDNMQRISHALDAQSCLSKHLSDELKKCIQYFTNQGHKVKYLGLHQGYSLTLIGPRGAGRLPVFSALTSDSRTIYPKTLPLCKVGSKSNRTQSSEQDPQKRKKLICSA